MKFSTSTMRAAILMSVCFGLSVPAFALNGDLQGLNRRDSTNWNAQSAWRGNNLRGWRELDLVPCRVVLRGPASNSPVRIFFPRTQEGHPGFEDLFFISNSPNASITQPPVLVAPADAEVWSYDFVVSITGAEPAYVYFYARLAPGANLNPGSSLHLWGEPGLSPLQLHKVRVAPVKPDLAVAINGPGVARPGETVIYTINYTNLALLADDTAHEVTVTAQLPPFVSYVPGSATTGGSIAGSTLTWHFADLGNQEGGTVSYQAVVSYGVPAEGVLTNTAAIAAAENDLHLEDNFSIALTSIVASSPTNGGALRITRIIKFNDQVYHIFFLTRNDRSYALQYTEDFVDWTTDPLVIPGSGGEVVSRQYVGGAKRFYRVMELP
jgi:uncharacterized repeat protein (TIGR01451 family)